MQRELQAVQTLIRLLLEEQSDLGLHCLPRPVCPKTWEHNGNCQLKQPTALITLICSSKTQKNPIRCVYDNFWIVSHISPSIYMFVGTH